jgi:hypothetical protein
MNHNQLVGVYIRSFFTFWPNVTVKRPPLYFAVLPVISAVVAVEFTREFVEAARSRNAMRIAGEALSVIMPTEIIGDLEERSVLRTHSESGCSLAFRSDRSLSRLL